MIAAVVPVAFYTEEHVEMTREFLWRLMQEVPSVTVFHNGGPLSREGWRMLTLDVPGCHVTPAEGYPFFRMWNEGIADYALEEAVLVLNNDIEWDKGALDKLGLYLDDSPRDVAIASPSPNGEPRHAFAIRPDRAPWIDERYHTWYGDVELEYLVKLSGLRCVHYDPGIRHPHIQTTTDHIPGIHDMRLADQKLFDSKWHPE